MPIQVQLLDTPRSMPWRNNFSRERGFTLIELIMTMVIVGIVSIPLALLVESHLKSVFVSEEDAVGWNIARCEMERVNNTAYASLMVGTSNQVICSGLDSAYTVTRVIAQTTSGAESYKTITINVTKGGKNRGSLVTYIVENITYGPPP